MVSFGLMIIPTAISAIDGITRLVDNWGNAQKSLHFILEMNPILKVVAVISVLTAAIAWAYQNVDWFREGVDSCFNVLKSAVLGAWSVVEPIFKAISGAIQWIIDLWNSLRAVLGAGVSVPTSPSEGLGSFEEKHEGGPILRTGPYILKAGEYVLPAGRRFGTVINGPLVVIQGSASKSDVEAAADYVVDEIERIDRG